MEGKPWWVYMLRLLIAWLRERINALAARIESSRQKKREGISSSPSAQSASLTSSGTAATTIESAAAGQNGETTLAAKHFPSDAASTQEQAVETVEGVIAEQTDPVDLSASASGDDAAGDQHGTEEAVDSPAKWPIGQSPSFTPDASLDLVDDIEFAFEPEPATMGAAGLSAGWVQGDGSRECPETFPIKGNRTSHIYHLPGQASYGATIAELCFATEADAVENGYRPTKRNRPSE